MSLLSVAGLALLAPPAQAADAKPKPVAKAAALPRTPDGHPDFQGVVWWAPYMAVLSTFPGGPTQLVLPEDQAKVAYERMVKLVTSIPAIAIDAEAVSVFTEAKGFPIVRGERRTRLVVQPADGKIPMTPAAARLTGGSLLAAPGKADNPEDRPPAERCIDVGALPPMAVMSPLHPREFVQTPTYIAIHVEYGDQVRVIPFATEHGPAALEPALGDSIARWEGQTLVIETTNNPKSSAIRPFPIGLVVNPDAKVIERFTPLSATELLYQFTILDPKVYTGPWMAEYSLYPAAYRMYPSGCHEGNYALANVLSGAREIEKAKAAAAK